MTHTLSDIYKDYKKSTSSPVSAKLFRDICSDFNIIIFDYLLEGKEFNMGNKLSTFSIIRRERDPRSPRIDWGESNKYKK